jgi:hypothetical protein
VGYGFQYLSGHRDEVANLEELALLLLVPVRTPALAQDLAALGLQEMPLVAGYSALEGLPLRLLLVDFEALVERVPEEFVALFLPNHRAQAKATAWWYTHFGPSPEDLVKPQDLEDYDQAVQHFLGLLTPEQRMQGLAPEERLQGLEGYDQAVQHFLGLLTPEQRLQGLAPAQRMQGLGPQEVVESLPIELLSVLPETYLASLPAEVQARVRARLARAQG